MIIVFVLQCQDFRKRGWAMVWKWMLTKNECWNLQDIAFNFFSLVTPFLCNVFKCVEFYFHILFLCHSMSIPHLLFNVSCRFLILSSALRANSSYSLLRFASILQTLFCASRQFLIFSCRFARFFLTFPNLPQSQNPNFQLFQTPC